MKKALLLCLIAAGSMSISATPLPLSPDIEAKIMKAFHAHFPEVTNSSIHQAGDNYIITFKTADNNSTGRIYYDSNGTLVQTIRYYDVKELSPFIRAKIEAKYKDKAIFMVTEVENDSEHYYQVILENANSMWVVQVNHNGAVHLERKYKKAA